MSSFCYTWLLPIYLSSYLDQETAKGTRLQQSTVNTADILGISVFRKLYRNFASDKHWRN